MSTLVTFPGRHGDLLWALPTVRAISDRIGDPVDLLICGEFAGLVPLLERQPYLSKVHADPEWGMGHGWNPPNRVDLISPYEATYHLGYRRWPERVLPEETWLTAVQYAGLVPPIDLQAPWITPDPHVLAMQRSVAFGFTDCHFELKYGICELLFPDNESPDVGIFPAGSRWITEGDYTSSSWLEAASLIASARLLLTDCSALHVLAVAMGVPVVMVEPMDARWNDLFYPVGKDGPQVYLVKGLDGQPTFDARHIKETLAHVLELTR